jgi:hypothetical protein
MSEELLVTPNHQALGPHLLIFPQFVIQYGETAYLNALMKQLLSFIDENNNKFYNILYGNP